MSTYKQAKNGLEPRSIPPLGGEAGQQLRMLTSGKIPRHLSQDSMRLLLDKVREGERNLSRSIISLTLNVNDVVAEYCLRHLEERMREEPAYADRVVTQLEVLPQANQSEQMQFLRYAFGVHGMVSTAILNHYRTLVPIS